ncbi:SAM-dependent methyltransferase RsmB/NOP2-type, partial [Dillenia turbinata]
GAIKGFSKYFKISYSIDGRSRRREGWWSASEKRRAISLLRAERGGEGFANRSTRKEMRAAERLVPSTLSSIALPFVTRRPLSHLCQTLKYLPVIKDWQEELMYIITYDILFSQVISLPGAAEETCFFTEKCSSNSSIADFGEEKSEKSRRLGRTSSNSRYLRVNTFKLDVKSAIQELGKQYTVQKDDLLPDLFVLPPGIDMHNHPLVTSGSVFLQGKLSSMVAAALSPEPGWEVLDACSAPENKTVHLAAFMRGKGKVIACELNNKERVKCLQNTIKLSGATSIL